MNRTDPSDFARRNAAIKRRWTGGLQVEPGWQNLESNDDLMALMDQILAQLWSVVRSVSVERWLERPDPVLLPAWSPGRCGLSLLVPFLAAGKTALVEQTAGAESRRRKELFFFDIVAQREIERVCRHCRIALDCPFAGRRPGRRS